MAAWDTEDMSAALPDPSTPVQSVSGAPHAPQQAPAGAPADAPKVNPQDAGWGQKQNYDYETYNKSNKELQEIQQANAAGPNSQEDDDQDAVGGLRSGDWAGNAAIYQWNDEYGDVGPEFPELEKQLFGAANHTRTGIRFEKVVGLEVVQETQERIIPVRDFKDAGLHPVMLRNTQLAGYFRPTPIQSYTLPAIFQGKDLIACAQTGSGKTAAFLIPILSKLMGKAKKLCAPRPNPATFQPGVTPGVRAEPLVLIVAPTRELATQIFDEARRFCYRTMFRPCVVYGGGPLAEQINQLAKGCDLLIGTPGRLVDFIGRPHLLTLKRLKYMVIDEADEMVQSDWETELKQIMSGGDQEEGNINYLMFSATFPKVCRELAEQHLAHAHVRIRVGRAGSTHDNIKQDIIFAERHSKRQCLIDLLMSMPPARTIVFVNSKRTADEIDDFLFNLNFPCTSIHSDRTQREREDSLRAFRKGTSPLLIATGVSARGLDIHNVMHVINYDLPSAQYGGIQEYIHRIGRTGRIGNMGLATSFYNSRDSDLAELLVKTLLETHQVIPDFLQDYIPEGFTADGQGDITKLQFETENDAAEVGGWGNEDAPAQPATTADNGNDPWGEAVIPEVTAPGGWGAHPDAAPSVPLANGGWATREPEPAQHTEPAAQVVTQPAWGAAAPATQVTNSAAPYGVQPQTLVGQPPASWGAQAPSGPVPMSAPQQWGAPVTPAPQPAANQWGAPPAPVSQPNGSQWGAPAPAAPVSQPAANQWSAQPAAVPAPVTQPSATQWGAQAAQYAQAAMAAPVAPVTQPSTGQQWVAAPAYNPPQAQAPAKVPTLLLGFGAPSAPQPHLPPANSNGWGAQASAPAPVVKSAPEPAAQPDSPKVDAWGAPIIQW